MSARSDAIAQGLAVRAESAEAKLRHIESLVGELDALCAYAKLTGAGGHAVAYAVARDKLRTALREGGD